MSTHEIARAYLARGWNPVPITRGKKGPTNEGWQNNTVTPENIAQFFNGADQNIGIQLGRKSGGLADVDLDCVEAEVLAPRFLPQTRAIFGRASKPRAHFLYYVEQVPNKASLAYKGAEGDMIIELRIGGGEKGAQTMAPGSTHPEGEHIEWAADGEPSRVNFAELNAAVVKVAIGAMLLRAWPKKAHDAALTLGGFLSRAGWDADMVVHFVEAIAQEAGDGDVSNRRSAAKDAAERYAEGGDVFGLPKMREQFGDAVANQIAKHLQYSETDQSALIEKLNAEYCLVDMSGKVRILKFSEVPAPRGVDRRPTSNRLVAEFSSAADFKLLLSNRRVKVRAGADGESKSVSEAEWWLNHPGRKQYRGLIFRPGEAAEIGGFLNLWRGWAVAPQPGDWSLMRRHIEEVLAGGVPEWAMYVQKWTAWKLQNPGLPPEVALVFRGGKGVGKGMYARAVCDIFGQHGLQIFSADQLVGKFNAHFMDCALLVADEAYWPGDKASEGRIKGLITERMNMIEPKGLNAIQVENSIGLIMLGNEEWIVPASHDERRYAVFNVSDVHQGDEAYFTALAAELRNGGLAAMMFDLLKMDLGGWHPRQDVPQTEGLQQQKALSRKGIDALIEHLLHEAGLPLGGVEPKSRPLNVAITSNEDLGMGFWHYAKKKVPELNRWNAQRLSNALKKDWGCKKWKSNSWRGIEFPELPVLRQKFEERHGPQEWDNPSADEWGTLHVAAHDKSI